MIIRALAILALLSLATFPATAQTMTEVRVMGEEDSPNNRTCQVAHSDAVSALQGGLRYNQVPVKYQKDGKDSLILYVNISSIPLGSGPACTVSYSLSLYEYAVIPSLISGKRHLVRGMFCDRAGIMTGVTYDLQSRLNGAVLQYLNQCIGDYQTSIIK